MSQARLQKLREHNSVSMPELSEEESLRFNMPRDIVRAVYDGNLKELERLIRDGRDQDLNFPAFDTHTFAHFKPAFLSVVDTKLAQLDGLVLAWKNGCPFHQSMDHIVIKHGDVECLAYMRASGIDWTGDACVQAALRGNVNMLRYVHQEGGPITTFHDPMCMYYDMRRDDPWIPNLVIHQCVLEGHLDCLKYIFEHIPYPNLSKDTLSMWITKLNGWNPFPKPSVTTCIQFLIAQRDAM